jgi:hypothetical protein
MLASFTILLLLPLRNLERQTDDTHNTLYTSYYPWHHHYHYQYWVKKERRRRERGLESRGNAAKENFFNNIIFETTFCATRPGWNGNREWDGKGWDGWNGQVGAKTTTRTSWKRWGYRKNENIHIHRDRQTRLQLAEPKGRENKMVYIKPRREKKGEGERKRKHGDDDDGDCAYTYTHLHDMTKEKRRKERVLVEFVLIIPSYNDCLTASC